VVIADRHGASAGQLDVSRVPCAQKSNEIAASSFIEQKR
jgi:hypothetical protein